MQISYHNVWSSFAMRQISAFWIHLFDMKPWLVLVVVLFEVNFFALTFFKGYSIFFHYNLWHVLCICFNLPCIPSLWSLLFPLFIYVFSIAHILFFPKFNLCHLVVPFRTPIFVSRQFFYQIYFRIFTPVISLFVQISNIFFSTFRTTPIRIRFFPLVI